MLNKIIIAALLFFKTGLAFSQDPFFSQFYNAPVYLNPALTGCGQNNGRLAIATRLQWIRLTNPMKYISVSADKTFFNPNGNEQQLFSGGILINHFSEGYIKSTTVAFPLAKNWGGNTAYGCSDVFFSLALQPGFVIGSVDRDKFLFIDQLGNTGPNGNASAVEAFKNNGKAYFTFSAGGLVSYHNYMFGFAAHNINNPTNGFIGGSDASKIPIRYTAHISHIFGNDQQDYMVVKPTLIYQQQGNSKMFTLGTIIDWPGNSFSVSLWYRDNWLAQNNTFTIGGILKLGRRRIQQNGSTAGVTNLGTSYDFEVTNPGIRKTYGSAEMGITTDFNVTPEIICPRAFGNCSEKYPWQFF